MTTKHLQTNGSPNLKLQFQKCQIVIAGLKTRPGHLLTLLPQTQRPEKNKSHLQKPYKISNRDFTCYVSTSKCWSTGNRSWIRIHRARRAWHSLNRTLASQRNSATQHHVSLMHRGNVLLYISWKQRIPQETTSRSIPTWWMWKNSNFH